MRLCGAGEHGEDRPQNTSPCSESLPGMNEEQRGGVQWRWNKVKNSGRQTEGHQESESWRGMTRSDFT